MVNSQPSISNSLTRTETDQTKVIEALNTATSLAFQEASPHPFSLSSKINLNLTLTSRKGKATTATTWARRASGYMTVTSFPFIKERCTISTMMASSLEKTIQRSTITFRDRHIRKVGLKAQDVQMWFDQ